MKIKYEQDSSIPEVELLIRYNEQLHKQEMRKIRQLLKAGEKTVVCQENAVSFKLPVSEIYYIESVDKHTFLYGSRKVFACQLRLYQLEEELKKSGFVRVSKSCIVNIKVLQSIRSIMNSRLEATLINGEKITVTRKYISAIRKALEAEDGKGW